MGNGNSEKAADKMLSYLDDFKDIVSYGEAERKKDFMRMFVKDIVMYPEAKQAKITLYRRPFSGIMKGQKECKLTEEISCQY